MNVLEKILEEIDKKTDYYESDEQGREHIRMVDMVEVEEIIRSHMGDFPDIDAGEKSILYTIGEDGMLTPYNNTYDVTIHCYSKEDQDQTVELIKRFNWISVSEHLPVVPEGTEDDDCPEFNVTIKGANKATTLKYSPDGAWFDDSGEVYQVVAWQPLPEPYSPVEDKP